MNKNRQDFLDMFVYQIYPRSFKDSNGDGIGDIKGIIEKLDYLEDLGVNAIWLSPCYKSPKYDNGYDISDYRDIDPDYGTLDDIKQLIAEMHSRNMKLFMDLVVNHTSSEHEWFKEARKSKDSPYHDYYIWAKEPLNSWDCCFGGSAWEYNEATDEYYLHSFTIQQPDLNWKNPKVRQECCDVVDFWINLGVDGFRCDVLDHIGKNFENNVKSGDPSMHPYINQLFGRKNVENIFTVGECWISEAKEINDICGKDRGELTTVFQFEHFGVGRQGRWIKTPFAVDEIKNILVKWQKFSAENDFLYTLFTDNHDQPYYISRAGNDNELRYECATAYAAMFFLLRGIPFIYQGQEFGSASPSYDSIDLFDDVETRNYYFYQEKAKEYPRYEVINQMNFGSRDNSRHPVLWNSNKADNYGFGKGKPWLVLNNRGYEISYEKDVKSEKSIFSFYKRLLKFRKENECIRRGDFKEISNSGSGNVGYFVFERTLGNKSVVVVCNFDRESVIDFPANESEYKFVLGNYSDYKPFDKDFRPFEIAVYEKL